MRTPISPHLLDPEKYDCGVVVFPDAVQPELDPDWVKGWVRRRQEQRARTWYDRRIKTDMQQDYVIDEDGNYINRGGYKFTPEQFKQAPGRLVGLKHGANAEDLEFVNRMDAVVAECLRVYMRIYPQVRPSIWWRTPSHCCLYEEGQDLGPHSDQTYERGDDEWNMGIHAGRHDAPVTEFPVHTVVTSGLTLIDECEGGELFYPNANLTKKILPGSVVLYPSSYIGTHGVNMVTSGTRVSYLQFFCQGTPAQEHAGFVDAWLEGPANNRQWVSNSDSLPI